MRGFVRVGKSGNPVAGITSSNPLLAQWRMKVTAHAMQATTGKPPMEGAVGIRIIFTLDRPTSHFGTGKNAAVLKPSAPSFPAKAPDIDKLVRAILDAFTDARVWLDDGQVVWCQATKVWSDATYAPGVYLTVGEML